MTQDIIDALRKVAANFEDKLGDANLLAVAADEIESLRRERDDARQMYCRGFTDFCPNPAHEKLTLEESAREVAKSFHWDCFREDGK
jgi:hypothetical protein